jgi:hypothetical protein
MIFDWGYFGFKFCADDPEGIEWPHCIDIPRGFMGVGGGCWGCDDMDGTCNNHLEFNYAGIQTVTLKLEATAANQLTAPIVSEIDMSGMGLNISGWGLFGIHIEALIDLANLDQWAINKLGEIPVDKLKYYIPIDYNRIVSGMTSQIPPDYQSSGELMLQYADSEDINKPFVVHNKPNSSTDAEISMELLAGKFTFDYILSNFASNGGCDTYKFPFMDHHAVMCNLLPQGDASFKRGGITKRKPKPLIPTRVKAGDRCIDDNYN